ncbi:hypothetical protein RLV_3976 [Rhizobium leguminosarum bv. viciae]|nr:hypothetical protein CHR56_03075 [Rhizobium leguminosarum bv. viciae]AVC49138.1 hypothetical protein RLV_3976 [Rhizobium leguminosarum bv. viciae]
MLVSSPDGLAATAALRCRQEHGTGMCLKLPIARSRHRQIGCQADEYNNCRAEEKTGRATTAPRIFSDAQRTL